MLEKQTKIRKKIIKMEDDLKDIGDGGDGKNKQDNYK